MAIIDMNQLLPSSVDAISTGRWFMSTTLNLSLTDELRAFVDQNSGGGTLYATPGEFALNVLREKKERLEAAQIRDAIRGSRSRCA